MDSAAFYQVWGLGSGNGSIVLCNIQASGNTKNHVQSSPCPLNATLCITSEATTPGATTTLQACVNSTEQLFALDPISTFLVQVTSGLCLTVSPRNSAVLDVCLSGSITQTWQYNGAQITPIVSPEGLCLTAQQNWGE